MLISSSSFRMPPFSSAAMNALNKSSFGRRRRSAIKRPEVVDEFALGPVRLSEAVERRLPSSRKHHASRDAVRPDLKNRAILAWHTKQIANYQGWQWPGEVLDQVDVTSLPSQG